MKTILAYGDSITWGSDPTRGGARHAASHRWPEVLARKLGAGFTVISEGLRGRTTAFDEHCADCDRNGAQCLPTALYTHAPVDLVILFLGTNDLKPAIAGPAASAMLGMRRCIEIVQRHAHRVPGQGASKVLVVSPPRIIATPDPFYADMFAGAVEESAKLSGFYAKLAQEAGCGFFDAATVAQPLPIDGVHCDAENTAAIGRALAPFVRDCLGH
ncbi:TesA Lysophospholipase L1 and related esterases [Rhabdaerophilaceae bacterium]